MVQVSGAGRALLIASVLIALDGIAHADPVSRDGDRSRSGWYADQPGLSPQVVADGGFGPRFSTSVDGAIYAQPLVFDHTLFIATQSNWIYGLDPDTGEIRWSRQVADPWDARGIDGCTDIFPTVGITSTPVIDDDTGIAYLTCKTYDEAGQARWEMHAVDVATGDERPNFPVMISGDADNEPDQTFHAKTQNQRPGLLLLDGVVYAAFGSACDVPPFQGWVIGVSTGGGITARWVDRSGSESGNGIWMSGSALASDGPGQILFSTGNGMDGGSPESPAHGSSPPADLGESIVRLSVQSGGSLRATDFFCRGDAREWDAIDGDIGSGGVIELPNPPFGNDEHPDLLLQVGKPGVVTLLDAGSFGGFRQGAAGGDAALQQIDARGGVYSKPAVWGGDGGWVYVPTATEIGSVIGRWGHLDAYRAGVDEAGRPTLTLAGSTGDAFGFSSSAPVVTSDGTASGSALVWIVWNAEGSGHGAELRAYDVLPVHGVLQLRYRALVGMGSKYNPPGVAANALYVGTRDGHVLGFGLLPGASPRELAERTRLGAAHPNPAPGATSLDLEIPRAGPATLVIFDLGGRRVRRLLQGRTAAGTQRVVWDGRDDRGEKVPAGMYLARLDAVGVQRTRPVVLVR